jgi:hypothetical protein
MTRKFIFIIIGGVLLTLFVGLVLMEQKGVIPFQGVNKSEPEYATNEILVGFKKDISEQRIEEINKTLKTQVIKVWNLDNYQLYNLKILENATVPELIKKYQLFSEVEYVGPNYFVHIDR